MTYEHIQWTIPIVVFVVCAIVVVLPRLRSRR